MTLTYRDATVGDIPALMAIRGAVRENRLTSVVLTAADYEQAMFVDGHAIVCEDAGAIVGFACGRVTERDIWALFLRESHEGRGIGNELMARIEAWMFDAGVDEIGLVTEPGTRAERLYRGRGWTFSGVEPSGELRFTLPR